MKDNSDILEIHRRVHNIRPSGRPSIHSSISYQREMTRYHADDDDDQQDHTPERHQDLDEVDNVMSKFSSSPITKVNRRRRKSLTPNLETEDDSDDNLAKSLPNKLPSYDSSFNERTLSPQTSPTRNTSGSHYETSDSSFGDKRAQNRHISQRNLQVARQRRLPQESPRKSNTSLLYGSILVLVASILIIVYKMYFIQKESIVNYDKPKYVSDINGLGEKYNINDDSMLQLRIGITNIFKKEDAGSFIFVYRTKNHSNKLKFNKFMEDVAYSSAKYLRNNSADVRHIVVEPNNLDMRTHTELINKYRYEIDRTGVMLVKEVDDLPSNLAMAFHYYCDEYNPLAKKSAIFFTLNLENCYEAKGEAVGHYLVEKCLKQKWKGVPQDNIGPLLTRVVGTVVDVTTGF